MRLAGLLVRNYKMIGATTCSIRIDDIVVLVGRNNSGKSTILDAYEVFASGGKELDESHFHDAVTTNPIEITGVFNSISQEDEDVIGKKWTHEDHEYAKCIKVRWVWSKPGVKGQKQSYDPTAGNFVDGGVGGWDSLIQSRIPQPVRIRPTDPIDATQTKIVAMLKDYVKSSLKADASSTKAAFDQIELLAKKVFEESKASFDDVAQRITANVSQVFPGTTIEVVPRSKDAIDEKLIAADSYLRIGTHGNSATPLSLQGTGIQRALLWSALSVMSEAPGKKKPKTADDVQRILLIDEPEAFLHPPTVRNARESLYDFALNNPEWQVIATTHSPILIDLSKDHTTIIRVDPNAAEQHFVSTDIISFDNDERTHLKMVRACNPVVNEFFFYENVVLVEGPTEHLVVKHVSEKLGLEVHVIDCMGKGNVPLFARVLNHFKMPYIVIHDSDTPKFKRKGVMVDSGAWSLNEKIRVAAQFSSLGQVFTQFPHFEGEFLDEELTGGKVDRVLDILSATETSEYAAIIDTYTRVLKRDAAVFTTTEDAFESKRLSYVNDKKLHADPHWI
ncbi:ATP-dependent nuclease [Burkholderia stagnalis]|uniref:ATP-dependent endonuclease n=1 Tax=Burkholderia stagnalis TaxID=1503054 RepID=A0ABX9YEF2_9BURK|nr:AAA family ATPase [Burkholderia stagnalis]RQQ57792.1 ATP-dependent endonuclease [Burkholderia stagnalis]RQQ60910.1 ATP-dependent endonuclease [Burkholderia stagnalis]RQQ67627.1 ATP-dependent endonuclease [Burkholderia stagnalis]RQQ79748.1 ATP-dependent endonuclease [Burkholderia stagnalis]RQQ87688.1 ATP-dependent endonuclease [Burkholderia stagnalis]